MRELSAQYYISIRIYLNGIAEIFLVCGINTMLGNKIALLGNKVINLYCEYAHRDTNTARLVSANTNEPEWKNIHWISKKWIQLW